MLARLFGPSVVGLVWSKPLSIVISAAVPPSWGSATYCTGACVTTSSGKSIIGGRHWSAFARRQCGFSQITAPPMPMPMHMAVRP